jgi:hypothetical protein
MTDKEIPTITFTVTTREMFDSFMDALKDIIWDTPIVAHETENAKVLAALANGEMNAIRDAFIEGNTPFLVPNNIMLSIDKDDCDVEIRIMHDGKLIGIVIDSELIY